MRKGLIIMLCLAGMAGSFAQAQNSATIRATVPDVGQGESVQVHVAQDLTEQFESRYGAHSEADQITSDIMMWLFLLFMMIIVLTVASDWDLVAQKAERVKSKA